MSKLIAIEGLDGSGKETQSNLLCKLLCERGQTAQTVSFPDYESPGAEPLKMYLSGQLGTSPSDTNAFAASAFFAVDRYITFHTKMHDVLNNDGAVIIANRYTTANAYHQMAKLDRNVWDDFLTWLWEFEFERLALPKPDGVIMLSLDPAVSAVLIDGRCEKTGAKKDIHEKDAEYLRACRDAAYYASEKLGWHIIECGDGCGGILPIDEIHRKVCDVASKILGFEL